MNTENINKLKLAIDQRELALANLATAENEIQKIAALITKEKLEEAKAQKTT